MMPSPEELLDTSIAQLETLRAFLDDQLREIAYERDHQSATAELRVCNEILLSLDVLVSSIQAERHAISGGENWL